METLPSIAILGTGSMGGAILGGLTQPGVTVDGGIRVTNRTVAKARPLASDTVESFALEETPDANLRAVTGARIVLLGVKPAMIQDLLREVAESKIDALSTISGSGPAYVFYLIEELTRTAIDLGFTPDEAAIMVNGTFLGASELLASSDVDPAELRRRVTSPKGTTEQAIGVLESAGLKALFDRATGAALARARELAAG